MTLTYAPEHLPRGKHGKCILRLSDYQSFMKRFRTYLDRHHDHTKVRFFHCGEFGSKRGRSHYHSLIFGFDFPDKEFYKFNKLGQPLYRSPTLDKLWGKGICIIGEVTYQSAGYVARYCMKKNMEINQTAVQVVVSILLCQIGPVLVIDGLISLSISC